MSTSSHSTSKKDSSSTPVEPQQDRSYSALEVFGAKSRAPRQLLTRPENPTLLEITDSKRKEFLENPAFLVDKGFMTNDYGDEDDYCEAREIKYADGVWSVDVCYEGCFDVLDFAVDEFVPMIMAVVGEEEK